MELEQALESNGVQLIVDLHCLNCVKFGGDLYHFWVLSTVVVEYLGRLGAGGKRER